MNDRCVHFKVNLVSFIAWNELSNEIKQDNKMF